MKEYKILFGVGTFIAVNLIIALFHFLSDLKLTADGVIGTISLTKVIFSMLFIFGLFVLAFIYGYQCNISGLIGLAMVFVLPFIGLLGGVFYLLIFWSAAPYLPIFYLLEISTGSDYYIGFSVLATITAIAWFLGKFIKIKRAKYTKSSNLQNDKS
ncbi:MAG TPA: hypothetical protein PK733_08675 [Clostridiales bacterium]|nr:hypothetical protein [Clostridiales bacterium]